MKINTFEAVSLTDVMRGADPEEYAEVASDAPFSWGDNDATLVRVWRFLDHYKEAVWPATQEVLERLEGMDQSRFIDLES